MKVFIQSKENGLPASDDMMTARSGFEEMGFEIIPFSTPAEMSASNPEDIIVGYVGTVRLRLNQLGFALESFDYPEELQSFLGRKVWASTMNTIAASPELWPVFVKSKLNKRFTGKVICELKDLNGGGIQGSDTEVWCSEIVHFVSEYRVYIRYREILDVRRYKGDWRVLPDPFVIQEAVCSWKNAPAGYALDFGVTEDGKTLLIEANDGHSLGNYGLFNVDYAKLLSARWAELTGSEDECDFDQVWRNIDS